MHSFEIVGIDRKSGSDRNRVYSAADLDAAVRMASADGIIVESNACRRIVEAPPDEKPAPQTKKEQTTEETLFKGNPAMFRNSPIWFGLLVLLTTSSLVAPESRVMAAVWALVLAIWWLRCKCSSLQVTNQRVILRTGILSKNTNEVRHQDIRNIKVKQTFQQRIYGTGGIYVSSAGQSDMEIKFQGLANPQEIADLIRSHQ